MAMVRLAWGSLAAIIVITGLAFFALSSMETTPTPWDDVVDSPYIEGAPAVYLADGDLVYVGVADRSVDGYVLVVVTELRQIIDPVEAPKAYDWKIVISGTQTIRSVNEIAQDKCSQGHDVLIILHEAYEEEVAEIVTYYSCQTQPTLE